MPASPSPDPPPPPDATPPDTLPVADAPPPEDPIETFKKDVKKRAKLAGTALAIYTDCMLGSGPDYANLQQQITSAQTDVQAAQALAKSANDQLHIASVAADPCWNDAEAASAKAAGKDCNALKAAYQSALTNARTLNASLQNAQAKVASLQQQYNARYAKDDARCRGIAQSAVDILK
jgi:chromosome segregation ATPase